MTTKHFFIGGVLLALSVFIGGFLSLYLILWSRSAGIDLGDNYEYIADGPYAVVKTDRHYPAKDIIVEGKVLKYDYDNQTIILLTQDVATHKDSLYWVIDKASGNPISFKDYFEFKQYLRQTGIPLSLNIQ